MMRTVYGGIHAELFEELVQGVFGMTAYLFGGLFCGRIHDLRGRGMEFDVGLIWSAEILENALFNRSKLCCF